jgi:CheY-like chemotaxis protein
MCCDGSRRCRRDHDHSTIRLRLGVVERWSRNWRHLSDRVALVITHPRPTADAVRVHPTAERGSASVSSGPRLDGIRILAVDDDEDALMLLRTILETAGATVVTVVSAAKAIEVLDDDVPNVLISDIGMPGMNGFELIKAVRARSGPAARIAAAALTAYARSEDRITALSSGFQIHLSKPVDPLDLVASVAALARRPN